MNSGSPEDRSRREAWLRRLEEAVALPADDPDRLSLEAELEARAGWAKAHWADLLAESEAWHVALADAAPPEGLEERLHAIADQHAPRLARVRPLQWAWAGAALVLLALGVSFLLARGDESEDTRVREVALLALSDHLHTHEQDVLTSDADELERGLQPHIPFPLDLPDLGTSLQAVGGRRCTLGSHVVAFTAWRGEGGRLTLLQLQRGDFGLPADMPGRIVHPEGSAARGRPLGVFFFGRGDFVWVVVADDAEDLRRARRAITKS